MNARQDKIDEKEYEDSQIDEICKEQDEQKHALKEELTQQEGKLEFIG